MTHPGVTVAMEYFVLLLSVLVDTDLRKSRLQKYKMRFHKVSWERVHSMLIGESLTALWLVLYGVTIQVVPNPNLLLTSK